MANAITIGILQAVGIIAFCLTVFNFVGLLWLLPRSFVPELLHVFLAFLKPFARLAVLLLLVAGIAYRFLHPY